MRLYVLMDYSGSMRKFYEGQKRRIDVLRDQIKSFIGGIEGFKSISLYYFAEKLNPIGTFSNQQETLGAIDSICFDPSGGTRIWDCIDRLLNEISTSENSLILCITDGYDEGSGCTYSDIANKVKSIKNLQLKIIDIMGNLKENDTSNIIKTVETMESINTELKEIVKKRIGVANYALKISVPIMPVIDCAEDDIELVRSGILQAIPYLENLTNLRYYPVPTYIVDEYILRQMHSYPEKGDFEQDPSLKDDILEMLRFLEAVCITFHTGSFLPEELIEKTNYKKFSKLSPEALEDLRCIAEAICCRLKEYVRGERYDADKHLYFIDEISDREAFISNCFDDLKAILGILTSMSRRTRESVSFAKTHFSDRDEPNQEAWRRRLSKKEFETMQTCLYEKGLWKKDLESIISIFEIALKVIFDLIYKYERLYSRFSSIIKEFHTYGVYLPSSDKMNSQFNNLLQEKGFPNWFRQENTGKVLICMNGCRERLAECLGEKSSSEKSRLFQKLITATLVHEHAHAIIFEGISLSSGEEYFSGPKASDGKFNTVSEALAEWAELNFFREDNEIFTLILQHARGGKLPAWPYAGALLVEKHYGNSGCVKYRALLDYFRRHYREASKLLSSFNY